MLLLSRYYLSRFKDTYRQATIDMMLGELLDFSVKNLFILTTKHLFIFNNKMKTLKL
jgi:hypothetical protein